jgi:minichromosome maintenance protein 10
MSVAFERVTAADVTAAAKPRKEDLVAVEGNVANRDALAPRGVEHGFRLDTIHNSA